jgi:hypothetical protein
LLSLRQIQLTANHGLFCKTDYISDKRINVGFRRLPRTHKSGHAAAGKIIENSSAFAQALGQIFWKSDKDRICLHGMCRKQSSFSFQTRGQQSGATIRMLTPRKFVSSFIILPS